MPRQARIDFSGGLQHLMVRGIERKRILQRDLDRNAFVDRLGSLLLGKKSGTHPIFVRGESCNHTVALSQPLGIRVH